MSFFPRFSRPLASDRILFVSSATTSADIEGTHNYFASMIAELAFEIQRTVSDYDLVIKVPKGTLNDVLSQQVGFIENAVKNATRYKCIICAPVDRDKIYDNLKAWIRQCPDNRLLFIDQGFSTDDYEYFHDEDVPRPPYVQADWYQGGKIAGKSMLQLMHSRGNFTPHILIVMGLVGSEQRVKGFEKAMLSNATKPDSPLRPTFDKNIQGHYSRKSAMDAFEEHLKMYIKDRRAISGVFATNDEMALGVRDVLIKYRQSYLDAVTHDENRAPQLPAVIGFDGIRELTFYIDIHDEFIYDTVDVGLKAQVTQLSEIVKRVVLGLPLSSKQKYLQLICKSYRESKALPT